MENTGLIEEVLEVLQYRQVQVIDEIGDKLVTGTLVENLLWDDWRVEGKDVWKFTLDEVREVRINGVGMVTLLVQGR